MIKNKFKEVALATMILGTSLVASDLGYTSLVGVEGGYSSMDYEYGTTTNNTQHSVGIGHVGLKIGAESSDFRVFLSGQYFYDFNGDYSYITTYGGAIQYKFNVSESLNLFMGVNGGIANIKFRAEGETSDRTISDPYVGGDIGANIHLSDTIDFEFGGRVMSIQATNTKAAYPEDYKVGNIVTAYTSLIFKWKMD